MVLTTSMGIGLFMTIMTIYYYMSNDPIPQKSDVLYRVLLDAGNPDTVDDSDQSIPRQITYIDATNLIGEQPDVRQIVMYGATGVVNPDSTTLKPMEVPVRATTYQFFDLFDVPFEYGASWDRSADESSLPVVVISKSLNEKLFGGTDSLGRSIEVSAVNFQIVGVLQDWTMLPKAYDLNTGPFDPPAELFIPFTKAVEMNLPRRGNTNCWKPVPTNEYSDFLNSECVWIQAWVELPTTEAYDRYSSFLTGYIEEQKLLGRFERPNRSRLYPLTDWLVFREAVPPIVFALLASSFMFLLVCQCNTLSLLMAKLLSNAREIGIRRALGASRTAVFFQIGVEAFVIGVLGSVLGLLFTLVGLEAMTYLLRDEENIEQFFRLDTPLILTGVTVAIVSTLLVALYPMFRASYIAVASQLRASA